MPHRLAILRACIYKQAELKRTAARRDQRDASHGFKDEQPSRSQLPSEQTGTPCYIIRDREISNQEARTRSSRACGTMGPHPGALPGYRCTGGGVQ
ncbi:hypothetical protein MTO96_026983 [Rhipicephalus appendiculatus]